MGGGWWKLCVVKGRVVSWVRDLTEVVSPILTHLNNLFGIYDGTLRATDNFLRPGYST